MKNKALELNDKLIALCKQMVEVEEILIFGRIAEGSSDEYSDVDIRLVSKDPYKTQHELRALISKEISPIIETFLLASNTNEFSEMWMLNDYAPYQKIDLGIIRRGYGLEFKNIKSVFMNKDATGEDRNFTLHPIENNVEYNLNNYLFGVPRFTKCLFRKDFDLYRRWKTMTDALLVLLEEKYFGFEKIQDKKVLNAPDSKRLLNIITYEDQKTLEKIMPLNGNLKISKSFLHNTKFFVELSKQKARKFRKELNSDFINHMI